MDAVIYEEWTPPDEETLAKIVEKQAKYIFGEDCLYFGDLKKKIMSLAGAGSIPDGWAVVLGMPTQVYPVELEHSSHDIDRHISPQVDRILRALNNAATQQKIADALYDQITGDEVLNARAKATIGFRDLHKVLSDAISKEPHQLVLAIDSTSPLLREWADKKPVRILEFRTFRQQGAEAVHIHQFEPLMVKRPPTLDTIVVPAQEDGFRETFLGEDRWYAIRIGDRKISALKYIAVYRVAPISAVTHWATVRSIEPWPEKPGKFVVNFDAKAKEIGPIRPAPGGKMQRIQGPVYTSSQKLLRAKNLDELLA